MLLAAISTVLAGFLLPAWVTLILVVLVVSIIGSRLGIPPILSVGTADIWLQDLLVVSVGTRILVRWAVWPQTVATPREVPKSIVAFMAMLALATVAAYSRFGRDVFALEAVSLARFYVPVAIYVMLVLVMNDEKELRYAYNSIYVVGLLAASSILFSVFLASVLGPIGEINPGPGYVRHQGLLGDSVKVFLLPFVFAEIAARRPLRAGFFLTALLATGGRVGVAGLFIGLLTLGIISRRRFSVRQWLVGTCMLCIVGLAVWFNLGGVLTRFTSAEELSVGLRSRMSTWALAATIVLDNPLIGVGHAGYDVVYARYLRDALTSPMSLPLPYETYSQFLKAGVEAGILGVVTFAWMLASLLRLFRGAHRVVDEDLTPHVEGSYAWLWSLVCLSPFAAWMVSGAPIAYLFWIYAALATIVLRQGTEQPELVESSPVHTTLPVEPQAKGQVKHMAPHQLRS